MKLLRGLFVVAVAAWSVSEARAQFGLYGSPEPLPLATMQPVAYGEPAAPTGPVTVASVYQPTTASLTPPYYQMAADGQAGTRIPLPPAPVISGNATPAYGVSPSPSNMSGPAIMGDPPAGTPMAPPNGQVMEPGYPGCAGGYGCGGGRQGCLAPYGCGEGGGNCCNPWYATVLGLAMTRDRPNKLFTTAQTNALENQWTDNHFDWTGGGEVRVGYRFGCCCQWAIEGSYWTLGEFHTDACPDMAGPYSTPFTMKWVYMQGTDNGHGASTTADEWFDAASQHRIQRTDEVQNAEINLIRMNLCGGGCGGCGGSNCGCGPLSVDALVGFRFFRFRDRLVFSSQHGQWDSDGNTGSPYEGDWITLNDEIANNLWGVQVGCNLKYCLCNRLSLFVTPKVGLYDNHMTLDYNISAGPDNCYQGSSPTYKPLDYPIHSSSDGLSILTQVDVGLNWQISCNWEALVGYRLVAVTGMGLADNQVPFYGNDTQAVAAIDKNGSLLLHGVFAGLTFRF
ncbi:MAG: BBP7 family outer membrane beta-barrel protein [Thermoguttaceae bacterium]